MLQNWRIRKNYISKTALGWLTHACFLCHNCSSYSNEMMRELTLSRKIEKLTKYERDGVQKNYLRGNWYRIIHDWKRNWRPATTAQEYGSHRLVVHQGSSYPYWYVVFVLQNRDAIGIPENGRKHRQIPSNKQKRNVTTKKIISNGKLEMMLI